MQSPATWRWEWGKSNVRVKLHCSRPHQDRFRGALWENPKLLAHYETLTPLGRIGEPDDIGGIAVFLASRAGAFVTGQYDGGRRRRHDCIVIRVRGSCS
jgi:NAD(P)-dependent dehydrogenase (short-subunit alcohol dehydrogenase family)